MEENRESQVWQRVFRKPEEPPASTLQNLIRESAELAALYRRFTEKLTGREKQLARQLLEMESANTARLRGVALLSGDKGELLKHWEPAQNFGPHLLVKCYHRSLCSRTEYAARCLDPQYGEVYRELSERQGKLCGMIAELLGRIQGM